MDDPNNRRIQLIKEIPASPSADETTCASTVGTSSHHPNNTVVSQGPLRPTREDMQRQVLHLGLASSGALSLFLVSVVPANILVGVTVVFLLWLTFLYRLFQMLQLEYNAALQGRGLGALLPESWYNQLVNTSFHEFMTDGTFVQENQHFLLYFIPGISVEQLNDYVDRLIPRHRRALHQPGLGNFLGEGFMRHLLGDQGLAERSQGSNQRLVPRRLELDVVHEDAASGLGDDEDDDARLWGTEAAEPFPAVEQVIEAEAPLEISHDDSASEDSEEDLAVDEEVVFDAAVTGALNFMNWAVGYTQHAVTDSVVRTTSSVVRATLGIGLFTAGAGIFGVWAGFWTPQDFRLPSQMPRQMGPIFLSSTLASGATAAAFMMFGLRAPATPPAGKSANSSSQSTKKTKKT